MTTAVTTQEQPKSLLDRKISLSSVNWETVLFGLIIILAVASRFYDLGARVMSHDESLHTYFSWKLFRGEGFAHTPLMHGPLQFHLLALSYFLFGDSDFTARIPVVLASIATIAFLWNYRRYLGRTGALVAAGLFLISPFMLYYGRYVRNEAFVALFGVVSIWAVLRYLDTGDAKYTYWLTAATVLHFTAKETSFIYVAQTMLFLGILLVFRIMQRRWHDEGARRFFIIAMAAALIFVTLAAASVPLLRTEAPLDAAETAAPSVPGEEVTAEEPGPRFEPITYILFGIAAAAAAAALVALIRGVTDHRPPENEGRNFLLSLTAILLLIALVVVGARLLQQQAIFTPGGEEAAGAAPTASTFLAPAGAVLLGLALGAAGYFALANLDRVWPFLRRERSFDLIILLGALILPHLAPFAVNWNGWNPTDYTTGGLIRTSVFVIPLMFLSVGVGLGWLRRVWLNNLALFYGVFIVLFTTVFTNGAGFFTGLVGSLGYWLEQQGVRRGSQPDYYYVLVQVPVYEYLAALGTLLAAALGIRWWLKRSNDDGAALTEAKSFDEASSDPPALNGKGIQVQALAFIGFWTITSLLAYTLAGEKMPWLTVHIALPMLLLSGWALGYLIEKVNWGEFRQKRGWLAVLLLPVFVVSLSSAFASLLGPNPPFQGPELPQLQDTSNFVLSLITLIASGWGLNYSLKGWQFSQLAAVLTLSAFSLLALLTVKTSVTAAYIRYDEATEYLVYAHSARGVKDVMERIEDISMRSTDGLGVQVGFDDDVSWPFTWYLRNYYNQRYYHDNPTRDLRNAPVIVVGDNNFSKIEPIVGQAYYRFDYIRMIWPNQDYFDLSRMQERLTSPETSSLMRAALFNIWLDRDFDLYSQVTGADFSLSNWSPSDRMRLYVRKDVAATLWEYGVGPSPEEVVADPYEGKEIELSADRAIGAPGSSAGAMDRPRDIAVAPDGSFYVADSGNHRIQQFDAGGELINEWGSQPEVQRGTNAEGFFNEPWGVAVSPDGEFVYVADTWNHRIQKFTADGEFITQWGTFGQDPANPEAYWGPRGVAVDGDGNVLLTDTGNKRVVVFDADGNFVTQFGGQGFAPGEFDEPVGIAVDPQTNNVFVADTWNQRVQVFARNASGNYQPVNSWDIFGWFGQSLENKPYLEVASGGRLFIADPEAGRILEYRVDGEFVQYWVAFNPGGGVTLPIGIGVDPRGGLWASDGTGNQIVHYPLP